MDAKACGGRLWQQRVPGCACRHEAILDHHYQNNDHHPEHFELGINGMNLLQLLEMLAD